MVCVVLSLELLLEHFDIRICDKFWSSLECHSALLMRCRNDFAIKYITATGAIMDGICR